LQKFDFDSASRFPESLTGKIRFAPVSSARQFNFVYAVFWRRLSSARIPIAPSAADFSRADFDVYMLEFAGCYRVMHVCCSSQLAY
jgi:hypothetical protein